MEFTLRLMTAFAAVALSMAQLNYNNPVFIPEYIQTQSSYVAALQQPPSAETPGDINLSIQQLPKADAPKPFFTVEPQPITVLKAPTEDAVITNFNTQSYPPAPSEDLQLPSLIKWNPNDDPNLYYPVIVNKATPVNIPTNLYPKKYSKTTQKVKPSAFKPKDVESQVDSDVRQKQIDKALYALAKQENKKLLELEQLSYESEQKVNDPEGAESGFAGFPSSQSLQQGSGALSHGGFSHDALSHPGGLSSSGGHGGERMEFHIQGHDGPKSYKFGFDTGKGHNRHFRFEEKDKHGVVKGHYGYYDKHGKLRLVHYDSHPHQGFHRSDGDVGQN